MTLSDRFNQIPKCKKCNNELTARTAAPKMLNYVLFIISFLAYFWVTSKTVLNNTVKTVWVLTQVLLGGLAMYDRIKSKRPIYYCRTCNERLTS